MALGFVAFAVNVFFTAGQAGDSPSGDRLFAVALLAVPVVLVAAALRLRILLLPDRVEIRNITSTKVMRLRDIVDVSAGYNGVRFVAADGTTAVASAVQKSNAASWAGASTRADGVVRATLAARDRLYE